MPPVYLLTHSQELLKSIYAIYIYIYIERERSTQKLSSSQGFAESVMCWTLTCTTPGWLNCWNSLVLSPEVTPPNDGRASCNKIADHTYQDERDVHACKLDMHAPKNKHTFPWTMSQQHSTRVTCTGLTVNVPSSRRANSHPLRLQKGGDKDLW